MSLLPLGYWAPEIKGDIIDSGQQSTRSSKLSHRDGEMYFQRNKHDNRLLLKDRGNMGPLE